MIIIHRKRQEEYSLMNTCVNECADERAGNICLFHEEPSLEFYHTFMRTEGIGTAVLAEKF
jgi:hypothetical protein